MTHTTPATKTGDINPRVLEHYARRSLRLPGAYGFCKLQTTTIVAALLVVASTGSLFPRPVLLIAALALQLPFIALPLVLYFLHARHSDDAALAARILTFNTIAPNVSPSTDQVVSALGERRAAAALWRLANTQIGTASAPLGTARATGSQS